MRTQKWKDAEKWTVSEMATDGFWNQDSGNCDAPPLKLLVSSCCSYPGCLWAPIESGAALVRVDYAAAGLNAASGSSGSCERQKKQLWTSLARLSGIQGEIAEKKEPLFHIWRWESARLVCTIYNTMAGSWLLPTGSRWPTTVFLSTRLHLSGRMLASAGVVRK